MKERRKKKKQKKQRPHRQYAEIKRAGFVPFVLTDCQTAGRKQRDLGRVRTSVRLLLGITPLTPQPPPEVGGTEMGNV